MRRTHYCGAYWRWGFHEDGVWSALRALGASAMRARATAHRVPGEALAA